MKIRPLRLTALLLALFALVLTCTGCDLDKLFSSNKQNGPEPIECILITAVRYDGNDIYVTYADGYEANFKMDQIALSYLPDYRVFSSDGGNKTMTQISPDASQIQIGGSNHTATWNPSSGAFDAEFSTGEHYFVNLGSSSYAVSAIGAPNYVYQNGELKEEPLSMLNTNLCVIEGKYYELYNDEIIQYVRKNLQVAVVVGYQQLITQEDADRMGTVESTAESAFESNSNSSAEPDTDSKNTFETESEIIINKIREGAFAELPALERISLPATIKIIGTGAFYNSPKLTEIVYDGTVEQWKQIKKAEGWDHGAADFIIRCTDGTVTREADSLETTTRT
ncbi:MAG: hypothetical protein E7666_07630 [Ruminococcaceae bacterium]|nr:hypothetical protein [Oscillospiraceae bacterium]